MATLPRGYDMDASRSPPHSPIWMRGGSQRGGDAGLPRVVERAEREPPLVELQRTPDATVNVTPPPVDRAADAPRKWLAAGFCLCALFVAAAAASPLVALARGVRGADHSLRGAPLPARSNGGALFSFGNTSTTVLLMRHCDKTDDSQTHCSPKGFRRAAFIQTLFGQNGRFPAPDRLYARKPEGKRKPVLRSMETLTPTAEKFALPIDVNYGVESYKQLAEAVRADVRSGKLADELVVIAWKHENLQALARALGWSKAPPWRWDDFDTLFVLTYRKDYAGAWRCTGALDAENFEPENSEPRASSS
mmetsp:Transcript_11429/g.34100  ORF Transcript_11429/g.34100 Transcript_11429/m.34100 type:complete len:306 (-) Transcript_11429:72-989(-)